MRGLPKFAPESADRGPLTVALFLELPLICVGFYVWVIAISRNWAMQDFKTVRKAGHDVIHGISPYPHPDPVAIAHATRLVYPPLIAYFFAPFAVMPYTVAAALFLALSIASILLALRLLGVRDWRCYGLAFLWYPALAGLGVGAIGPILTLLVALIWRYRDKALVVAPLLAITITLKLFLWPLAVWVVATRRWRTATLGGLMTAAAGLLPFLPLGVHVLRTYPSVLRTLDDVFGPVSFSTSALFQALGASRSFAQGGIVVLGVALALLILWLGRRAEGDRLAMTAAVGAALLLSPIVWVHYYVLLLVPVALARPRLAALWFVPLFFWSTHTLESNGELWRLLTALALTIAVTTLSLRRIHRDAVPSVARVSPEKRGDGPTSGAEPSAALLAG